MNALERIDRDAFHRLLFNRASSRGRITFLAQQLADELGISKFTVSRLMNELGEEKKVRKFSTSTTRGTTYVIHDPDGTQ